MTMDRLSASRYDLNEPALPQVIVGDAVVGEVRRLGLRPLLGRGPGRGRERDPRRRLEPLDRAVLLTRKYGLAAHPAVLEHLQPDPALHLVEAAVEHQAERAAAGEAPDLAGRQLPGSAATTGRGSGHDCSILSVSHALTAAGIAIIGHADHAIA